MDNDLNSKNWEHDPELYIPDGNVVLRCENTLFRIWKGILVMNSEIFRDLFSLASDEAADSEKYEGVPLVYLQDEPEDMRMLLRALLIVE